MPDNNAITPYDRALARTVYIAFSVNEPLEEGQGRGVLIDPFKSKEDIVQFQFPPKVSSDSRQGNWRELDVWGVAPLAYYTHSGPRNITLKTSYIIDGVWTEKDVKRSIQLIRGYFHRVKDRKYGGQGESDNRNLAIKVKLWAIGGQTPLTFRLKNVDIQYGETMIGYGSNGDRAFPLRTDISMDLASWTQESNSALSRLSVIMTPEWY